MLAIMHAVADVVFLLTNNENAFLGLYYNHV